MAKNQNQNQKKQEPAISSNELDNQTYNLAENLKEEKFSESNERKKYQHGLAAAQEAFKSATAAKAAVELSKSDSQYRDDQNGSDHNGGTISEFDNSTKAQIQFNRFKDSIEMEQLDGKLGFDKIHPHPTYNLSGSEGEDMISNNYKIRLQKVAENKIKQEIDKKLSALSLGFNNPTNFSREKNSSPE